VVDRRLAALWVQPAVVVEPVCRVKAVSAANACARDNIATDRARLRVPHPYRLPLAIGWDDFPLVAGCRVPQSLP